MDSTLTRRCAACGYRFDAATELCPTDGRPLAPADPAAAALGSFLLVERLGDGGMGAVYRAVHKRLGRVVAIKLLHKDLTSDRGLVGRFFAEARAANTIRHEHVVEVYDFVESADDVYFVMEYLKGRDLHDAIHRDAPAGAGMAPARAVAILEQIAAALHATHARNIVHRDLKPENVFLAERADGADFVKIFDFGVAKLDRPDGRATVQGAILGTPEYMAPEQAAGAAIDGRADLYSLGCIAYEMLTRRQIFGGGLQADILLRQITVTPPPLRTHASQVPPALDVAVMRALAKDPAKRPQTARAFAESLTRAIGRDLAAPEAFRELSRPTPPILPVFPALPALPVLAAPPRPRAARPRSGRDQPWRVLGLGAGLMVLMTGGILVATRLSATMLKPGPAPAPIVVRPTRLVTVLLQTVPAGAEIFDEHAARLGVTPYELVLPAGGARQVRFQKAGFSPADRRLETLADTTVAVHLDPEAHDGRDRARGDAAASAKHLTPSATIDPFGRSPGQVNQAARP